MTTAKSLVQQPWWEWRRGIVDRGGRIVVDVDPNGFRSGTAVMLDDRYWYHHSTLLPDLDDPATQGVLLAWCRELEPTAHPMPRLHFLLGDYAEVTSLSIIDWRIWVRTRGGWDTLPGSSHYGEAIALGLIALQEGR